LRSFRYLPRSASICSNSNSRSKSHIRLSFSPSSAGLGISAANSRRLQWCQLRKSGRARSKRCLDDCQCRSQSTYHLCNIHRWLIVLHDISTRSSLFANKAERGFPHISPVDDGRFVQNATFLQQPAKKDSGIATEAMGTTFLMRNVKDNI